MARVVVIAESQDAPVTYQERVLPSQMESDHFSSQLIERVTWAVEDAQAAERSADRPRPEEPADDSPERDPASALARVDRVPGGVLMP